MNTEAERPTGDQRSPAATPSIIAIAADSGTHERIADALAEQDLAVAGRVATVGEVAPLEPKESAVILFACDVDTPREMTSLRRLCRDAPEAAVIVISPPAAGPGVRRALDGGATGVVFAPELELTLGASVHAVARGQSVVPRNLRAGVEKPVLSHREHQVLVLVRKGLTNAEIAKQLFLAESTIKSHVASIFTKFGVRSRKEVAAASVDFEGDTLINGSGNSGSAKQAPA